MKKREFFQEEIDQFYSENWDSAKYRIDSFKEGLCCIVYQNCPDHREHFYRAKVLRLKGAELVVSLIDYSKILPSVHRESARALEDGFLKVASFGIDISTEEFGIVTNKMDEIEKTFFELRDLFLNTKESVCAKITFENPDMTLFWSLLPHVEADFDHRIYFLEFLLAIFWSVDNSTAWLCWSREPSGIDEPCFLTMSIQSVSLNYGCPEEGAHVTLTPLVSSCTTKMEVSWLQLQPAVYALMINTEPGSAGKERTAVLRFAMVRLCVQYNENGIIECASLCPKNFRLSKGMFLFSAIGGSHDTNASVCNLPVVFQNGNLKNVDSRKLTRT
ncbi:unnamed protein product [Enterobius vermicularis]|uniref:Protein PBDC1 n=1 Tax=Enterobius vermicularis TaxID=51028 RepID=A0A0N4VKF0_ENTVE|nr:unnamed protein product [Enterobius vermicularis]